MEFLKKNKRFSFKLRNKNVWDLNYKSETKEDNDTVITTYFFEGGLKVTNFAKKYEKYGAYEWVNYIENTSGIPTDIISELWDCDCKFPLEHEETRRWEAYFPDINKTTKIYAPTGSTCVKEEFYSNADTIRNNQRLNHIYSGEKKTYSASGGRSSEKNAPFFNVHKNGAGYFFAIGWTGQWNCEMERTEEYNF